MTKIPPKNDQNPPQIIQKRPQIIQKRPQTLQKDLKNENKGQIVIFGDLFVIFGFFLYFFRGKTVGNFCIFWGDFWFYP
jgi:hypothetical protein